MALEKEVIDIIVEQLGVDAADVTSEKSFVDFTSNCSVAVQQFIEFFSVNYVDFNLRGCGKSNCRWVSG